MNFTFSSAPVNSLGENVVIYFTTKLDTIRDTDLRAIDAACDGALSRMITAEEFTGACGEIASLTAPSGFATERLLVVGLGKSKELSADSFRRAMGVTSRYKGLSQAKSAAICIGRYTKPEYAQAMAEGYLLGAYKLLAFKSGDAATDKRTLESIKFVTRDKKLARAANKAVTRGEIIAEGQLLARELAATPAGHLTPKIYAARAQKLARKHGLSCKVLDEKQIAAEKMGALLGVAIGSEEPPRFVILQHKGGSAGTPPVVLVGKGVTFDSGGISLKAGLNMHEMKQDMAGSAAVVSTMVTAARLKLPINLVGLTPLTENMPSGKATRPGDILTARNGKTIEIINTDAEGRLILADALDYANTFKPQAVVDVATLTGAALFLLGYSGAPIMGNHDGLLKRVESAAKTTSERVWRMPIWDDFREQMKSPIADLVNSGGRSAGTCAAGAFLENFVGDWPWAHVDIAYMDHEPKGRPYHPMGATGFGVRLFIDMLTNWRKM